MPAGLPYFAWIDVSETAFGSEHMRWDESVFSFELKQDEGNPASLTAVVRRPHNEAGNTIGLLGPGRKIWVWFALDCGPAPIKFRGRLVGIPTSIFEELVTLEFVARPFDVVAQKEALAATLRVLPFYDQAVVDPLRRKDPDVVLEGYTKIWHYDRETHLLSISDEISGEDGLVSFDGGSEDGKVFYDGLALSLTSGPLARVDINAEFTWTQQARGTVDLTGYLASHWFGGGAVGGNTIPGLNEGDWPKRGTGLGDGWEVADASAFDVFDFTTYSSTASGSLTLQGSDGEESSVQWSRSNTVVNAPITIINQVINTNTYAVQHDFGSGTASLSRSYSDTITGLGYQSIEVKLVAGYTAERQCTERVSLTLFADVQPILTDPEDGEALRFDDIRSVNLSDPQEGTLIGDPRRRSYIAIERGNQSLEHLIAFARAHLMKRARAVEITFAPKLSRMPEITLRKNVFLAEPRVGTALGKIIGYSIALDGSDGQIDCEVRMGCTIGRGGLATATTGTPTYCSTDYVGFDYQQFVGRTVLVDAFFDSSVGYQPPVASPNDDGINFMSTLTAGNVIEVGLQVHDEWSGDNQWPDTVASFKLKSMTREFSTDYEIQVTDLKVPVGYNLEAV